MRFERKSLGNSAGTKGRLRIVVTGAVQGVLFRATARDEARRLRLTGWVRNRMDGAVEIVAEGEDEALGRFLQWCAKGPPGARVERVEKEWGEYRGEFQIFEVRF
jgi:acylphosphatase